MMLLLLLYATNNDIKTFIKFISLYIHVFFRLKFATRIFLLKKLNFKNVNKYLLITGPLDGTNFENKKKTLCVCSLHEI